MSLSADQSLAMDAVMQFLLGDSHTFILNGPPGSGKSYCIKYITEQLFKTYHQTLRLINESPKLKAFQITATTNPVTGSHRAMGMDSCTIHSLLNLVVSNGKLERNNRRPNPDIFDSLIIIDEYTMIDYRTAHFINQFIRPERNNKIILVGDPDQLLGVGLTSPLYHPRLSNTESYTLTTVHRTSSEQIKDNCRIIRDWLHGNMEESLNTSGPDVFYSKNSVEEEFKNLVNAYGTDSRKYALLTYSNQGVHEMNSLARSVLNLPSFFIVGEQVTVNKAFYETGKAYIPTDTQLIISDYLGIITINPSYLDKPVLVDRYSFSDGYGSFEGFVVAEPEKYKNSVISKIQKEFSLMDVRNVYARTIYKAQGASVDHVLLDLSSFSPSISRDTLIRSLYVAFSRARFSVTFVGELHETLTKYF